MPTLFIGLLALILVLWLLKSFARSDPRYLIKVGKTAGGIVALAGAAFLGTRGQLLLAVPLGVTGLSLLGLEGWLPAWIRPYSWPFARFGLRCSRSPILSMKVSGVLRRPAP